MVYRICRSCKNGVRVFGIVGACAAALMLGLTVAFANTPKSKEVDQIKRFCTEGQWDGFDINASVGNVTKDPSAYEEFFSVLVARSSRNCLTPAIESLRNHLSHTPLKSYLDGRLIRQLEAQLKGRSLAEAITILSDIVTLYKSEGANQKVQLELFDLIDRNIYLRLPGVDIGSLPIGALPNLFWFTTFYCGKLQNILDLTDKISPKLYVGTVLQRQPEILSTPCYAARTLGDSSRCETYIKKSMQVLGVESQALALDRLSMAYESGRAETLNEAYKGLYGQTVSGCALTSSFPERFFSVLYYRLGKRTDQQRRCLEQDLSTTVIWEAKFFWELEKLKVWIELRDDSRFNGAVGVIDKMLNQNGNPIVGRAVLLSFRRFYYQRTNKKELEAKVTAELTSGAYLITNFLADSQYKVAPNR